MILSIIAIMFSIYKQANGGADCVIDLSNITYDQSIQLVPYTGIVIHYHSYIICR